MGKVPSALETEIAGEKAASLGRSGRWLRAALDKLRKFDSGALKRRLAADYGIPPDVARSMKPRLLHGER